MKQPTELLQLFRWIVLTQTIKTRSDMKDSIFSHLYYFENHSILYNFFDKTFLMSCSLIVKIFDFLVLQCLGKSRYFYLHAQYVYQMKAENILNSNVLPKSTILGEIFIKTEFSKFLLLILTREKFWNANFSKNIFYNPQIHIFQLF